MQAIQHDSVELCSHQHSIEQVVSTKERRGLSRSPNLDFLCTGKCRFPAREFQRLLGSFMEVVER